MQQLSLFFNQIHCISLVSFIHIDSIRRVKAKQYGFICQNALRNFPPASEKSTALMYITKDFHASMWFNMVLNKGIWKVFWSGKFPWSPKSFLYLYCFTLFEWDPYCSTNFCAQQMSWMHQMYISNVHTCICINTASYSSSVLLWSWMSSISRP